MYNVGMQESIIERINRLERQALERGELVSRPGVTYRFQYLSNPEFLASPNRDVINQLGIDSVTVAAGEATLKELRLKRPIEIVVSVPAEEDRWKIIPSLGIGGLATPETFINLYFDPSHPKIAENLKTWRARQVAHEINHLARFQAGKRGKVLLDMLISEGLATHHEEFFGGIYLPTPWGNSLSPEELVSEWEKAKLELFNHKYDYYSWFFGIGGGHPIHTGYTLGTEIVRSYFKKNPRAQMRDVVRMDSKTILQKSAWK